MARFLLLLVLCAHWTSCVFGDEPAATQPVSQERLDAAFVDARAAVETALGRKLDPAIRLRIVEPRVMGERVAAENLPAIRLRQRDEAKANAEAAALGEVFAQSVCAKYAWSTGEFLVAPEIWEQNAKALARPQFVGDQALRAVMVHEMIHALDDATYDFGVCMGKLATMDAVNAFSAVVEGHAQLETRRICAGRGWNEGFEAFEGSIGAVPDSVKELGELMELMARMTSVSVASAYRDGERFMAAIEAAEGADGIARAFRQPPGDMDAVLHPAWFLDPTARPKLLFDLERGLEPFAKRFSEDTWTVMRISLSSAQIEAAITLLPREIVDLVLPSIRANRAIMVQPIATPQSKLAVLMIMEFESDAAAVYYVEAARKLTVIKAEKMKEGLIRILESNLTDVEREGVKGFAQHAKVMAGLALADARAIVVSRGHVVCESVFSAEPIEPQELESLAVATLDAVRLVVEPPTPEATPDKAKDK